MAVSDAPITTYSDTTAHRRAIADLISIIDPMQTPVVARLGMSNSPEQFRIQNFPHTKVEWLEDDFAATSTTLNGSITSAATTITLTDASLVNVGHMLLIDSEYVWLASKSGEVGTVVRNKAGTQATHADTATVSIVGSARLEGADATYDYKTDVLAPYNYTGIMQRGVQVTRTQRKLMQWGISDEFDYQIAKKTQELTRTMEIGFWHSPRLAGSATTPRDWGGFPTFCTTNTSALSSAAITEKDILDQMQAIWTAGGNPDLMICNGWVKRKINDMFSANVRTERTESTGGVMVDRIDTDFGMVEILLSRNCPTTELDILSSEHVGWVPYDEFAFYEVARTGDSSEGEIIGEYTFIARHDAAHARITGISTTS